METIPCKECLVFPKCNQRYIIEKNGSRWLKVFSLYLQCPLFKKWWNIVENSDVNISKTINETFGTSYPKNPYDKKLTKKTK